MKQFETFETHRPLNSVNHVWSDFLIQNKQTQHTHTFTYRGGHMGFLKMGDPQNQTPRSIYLSMLMKSTNV